MNIKRKIKYLYSFILGLLGFSILGQYLELNVLKFPFYFVEIFFIPIILANLSSIMNFIKRARFSTVFLLLFVLTSMFSTVLLTGQVFSSIFSYRAILYLMFCVCYFRKYPKDISLNIIFTIALGAVCGEMIYILLLSSSSVTSSLNCLAIAIAIWIPYMQKKYILAVMIIFITLFLSINTGFRIGIIVITFTLLNLLVYSLINGNLNKKISLKVKTTIFFGALLLGMIYFVNNLYTIIEKIADLTGMSSFAVFRVTTRLDNLFNFNFSASQDTGRLEMFDVLLDRVWYIIPRGLIGSVKGGMEYSYYIDTPPTYLIDLFGTIVTTILAIYFVMKFVLQAKVSRVNSPLKNLAIWLLPLLVMLFLTNGTFMVNTSQAIITGTLLGYVMNKNKKRLFNKESESEKIV